MSNKIEQEYLSKLLTPLEENAMPTLSEYIAELEALDIVLMGDDGRIDRKFETHLRYLSSKRMISNADGRSDLKSMGFVLGADGGLTIVGDIYLMKVEREDMLMSQQITIGTINSSQVQVGNENKQVTNINIQELVEKVAGSNDPKAKMLLKELLSNSTVASVVGAGVSSLLSLL
ncbi:hypothetical protein [Salinivibrio sp. ML290]|uniref:hypothetical protein n=1 Tax=Salinivibrio sp. ML290 TaxID=1909468 RepID=UPI001F5174FF|nr:hypothetical protein [Salinivibrio sp. ML290]